MNDFYMLNQMDRWITGNYGEDRFDDWLAEPDEDEYDEDYDFEEEDEDE